jgi:stage V sporulation protein B
VDSSDGGVLRKLLVLAFPVTLSAVVMGSAKFIDLAMILSRLSDVGFTEVEANSLYGCYSTLVLPIFNILPSLTSSVSLSAVSALSSALQKGKDGLLELEDTATTALRLVAYIAIPATLGLSVFSKEILALLFSSQPDAVSTAAPWLSVMGLAVLPSCIITVSTGMLQAMGRAKLSLYSMLVGVVIKAVLAYILIGKEEIGVLGAPISSVVCDTLVACLNIWQVSRHCPQMLPRGKAFWSLLVTPTAAAVVSVGGVKLLTGKIFSQSSPVATLASIASVATVYAALMMIFNFKNIKTSERKKHGRDKNC